MNITRKLAENRALRSLAAAGHAEEEDRAIFARLNIRHGFRSLRGGEYKFVFKSGPHHEQWECRPTIPSAITSRFRTVHSNELHGCHRRHGAPRVRLGWPSWLLRE